MNLTAYAKLLLTIGLNLQPNEGVAIECDIESADLAREVTKQAYEMGASCVNVIYNDEVISKQKAINERRDVYCVVPEWRIAQRNYIVDNKMCNLSIISNDPDFANGIDNDKLAKLSIAKYKAFEHFYEYTMSNKIKWCVCGYPSKRWAKKLFPHLSETDGLAKLDELISKTMRLDCADPDMAWREHQAELTRRCEILNNSKIVKLKYKNSLGSDFEISPVKNYFFTGGKEKSIDGVDFTANMPTEEIFTSPDRFSANGRVYASLPLVHNGNTIENFYLDFKDGKIINFHAEKGEQFLKEIISIDEGAKYLGEIAFVQHDSPIQNLNMLFYETLYDENASCHLAIGEAYPTVEGAELLSKEERLKLGLNYSLTHVDFMIGTADMSIIGIKENGEELVIMKDGNFVF